VISTRLSMETSVAFAGFIVLANRPSDITFDAQEVQQVVGEEGLHHCEARAVPKRAENVSRHCVRYTRKTRLPLVLALRAK